MPKTKKLTIQEKETKRKLKNKTKRRKTAVRKTLKAHLTRIEKMGPSETVKIRLKRFLDYLVNIGKEKGKIDKDFFEYYDTYQEIAKFFKKKYRNKQCKDPETIIFDATDYQNPSKNLAEGSGFKSILKCILEKLNDKTSRQLIFPFISSIKNGPTESRHMSLLVINMDKKEIVRIDPEGVVSDDAHANYYFKEMGNLLKVLINKNLKEDVEYKYINDIQMDCPLNPQKKIIELERIGSFIRNEEHKPSELETETCVLWSFLFSELIIAYPEMEYKEVLRYLSLYIQDNFETTLYLIRGYFWYLQKEVFYMLNDEEKDLIPENKTSRAEFFLHDTELLIDYISMLETDPDLYYEPLEFIKMYERLKGLIKYVSRLDTTVKKAAGPILGIYEDLDKRFQKINTYFEIKKTSTPVKKENTIGKKKRLRIVTPIPSMPIQTTPSPIPSMPIQTTPSLIPSMPIQTRLVF
jgi:hypothetical protein